MYFWLKFFHIAAMAVWFAGLCFLPRLFAARHGREEDGAPAYFNPIANLLFFRVATPAAIVTIALGLVLMGFRPDGAWLVLKLAVVAIAVLFHLYFGLLLYQLGEGRDLHGPAFYRVLGWIPLALLLAIAAITAGKLRTVGDLPPPPAHAAGGRIL